MKESIIPSAGGLATDRTGASGGLAALGRRALLSQLAGLARGQLTIVDGADRHVFGRADGSDDLVAGIEVLDRRFWADAAFGGTVGAGESYIRGHWRATDLTALVRLMVRNRELMNGLEGGLAVVSAPLRRLLHWINRNSRSGSQRNIAAHYDLGNDFFRLMLDPSLAYSCGIYPTPASTLHDAQLAKFDAICRKLDLGPSDELLEIGTGWGGLAIHAARNFGCRVTTTTISREQHAQAREAIARGGPRLADHAAARGLPRPPRPVRQAGVGRDDRGGRGPVPRHLLRHLQPPAEARRRDAAAGDHAAGPVL